MSTTSLYPMTRQTFLVGLGIAVVGAILFSTKAIVAKMIYRYQVDAVTLMAFRMIFALPFFFAVACWKRKAAQPLTFGERCQIVALGLLGYYLSSFLDFLGLQYISAGLERLILFLTPSFVLLISFCFLKKKVSRMEWATLVVSYLGTVFVFLHDVRTGGPDVVLGCLLVLASAISIACYLSFSGRLIQRIGAMRMVAYAMCVSSVACILQFFFLRPISMLTQPATVYGLSIVNAIFCTVLPVFMTMLAVARIGAPSTALAGMVGPISTLFLAAMVLGEPITHMQLAGTMLVSGSIYLLSKKKI